MARAQFRAQRLQLAPAVIRSVSLTMAVFHVPVLPAAWANAFAGFAAHYLHRQRQQHYLTQDIIQVEVGTIVVCHFARLFLNGFFAALLQLLGGQILEVEIFFNRQLRCFQAPVASRFHCKSQRAANPDLA